MPFDAPALLIALALAASGAVLLALGARALWRRKLGAGSALVLSGVLLLALGALVGTLDAATRGYHALTREEVAARVRVEPAGEQRFLATFRFPGGASSSFRLAGDELYVDAHILKWKPFVNLLGLHTAYELDRVAGRYSGLRDEREAPRTVFSLAGERRVDLFSLRRRFPVLDFLVDAEYGSATFVVATRPSSYELRVSTSGLLVRPVSAPGAD
ncbi:MAG: hypothetical protein JRG76_18300 [Deltaproteobacteria bacterium]|nr:hypothetical protein [Deltaproteobacteria bacterium]MBW2416454.1 hypothetical protein [Deltaproteobacteria bacterium]